jgi:hypothetical protein
MAVRSSTAPVGFSGSNQLKISLAEMEGSAGGSAAQKVGRLKDKVPIAGAIAYAQAIPLLFKKEASAAAPK